MFTFFAISIGFSSMVFTNRNMVPLKLLSIEMEPSFAKQVSYLVLGLKNSSTQELQQFGISLSKKNQLVKENNELDKFDAAPFLEFQKRVPWVPLKRGKSQLPYIHVYSSFPFGLLRSWKYIQKKEEVIVYPELKGSHQFPIELGLNHSAQEKSLFKQHRNYTPGDPVLRVDWKVSQRVQSLQIREYEASESSLTIALRWEHTKHLSDFEERISQLALWVDTAESQGCRYSLFFGKTKIEEGSGILHWSKCMTALSLVNSSDLDKDL